MAGGQAELVVDPQKRVVAVRLDGELDLDEPAKERLVGAVAQALRGLLGLVPLGETRAVIALQGAAGMATAAAARAPKAAQPTAASPAGTARRRGTQPAGRTGATARAKVLQIARKLAGDRYRPLLAQRVRQMFGVEVPEDRDPELPALTAEQWSKLLRYLEQAAERRAG